MAQPGIHNFPTGQFVLQKSEFRNGSTMNGVSKRRNVSDPMPSDLEKILYKKLPSPREIQIVEFVTVMQALNKILGECAKTQAEKVSEETAQGDGEEKISFELEDSFMKLAVNSVKDMKKKAYNASSFVSLMYTIWKMKASETIETCPVSLSVKEEVKQFEEELSRGSLVIRDFQNQLDNCYSLELFHKIHREFIEKIGTIDESIDARKDDIQLELDMGLDKVNLPSLGERLCFLLGLELDAYDEIEEMDESIRDYHSPEEWILLSIKNSFYYLEHDNKNELSVEVLQKLGVAEHAANSLVSSIPAQDRGHLSTINWVLKYLKNQFKYHILLAPEYPDQFPFKQELTKTWFNLQKDEAKKGTSECDITKVHMINLLGKDDESFKTQNQNLFPESLRDEENVVLFHGTDHLSVVDILLHGIDLREGGDGCDFSYMKGFYLGDDFEDAISWSYKLPKAKPAVLVYKVRKDWLRDKQFLDLNGEESVEEWKNTVQFYHNGAKNKRRRGELGRNQFIEGPKVARFQENAGEDPTAQPGSYQLCITCEDFAEEFSHKLHSVLFYDKGNHHF